MRFGWIFLGLLAVLVATLETALGSALTIADAAPNGFALLSVAWVVIAGARPARICEAAGVGLLFDLNSGGHLGVGTAAFAVAAFVAVQLASRLSRLEPFGQALATAPLVGGLLIVMLAGQWVAGEPLPAFRVFAFRIAAVAIYTAAVSLPVWMIWDWRRDAQRLRARW